MAINKLVNVTYNDFKNRDVIDPNKFDENFDDCVDKIDEIVDYCNSLDDVTDSASGGDKIGLTAITDLTGGTVQSVIESLRNILKTTTDGSSGADFVKLTTISGLAGTTVQGVLESLKDYIDTKDTAQGGALTTHKTSTDHDSRYYTQAQSDNAFNGLAGVGRTTETIKGNTDNLVTHQSSSDHDGRYYTETELNNGQLDTRYFTETEVNSALSTRDSNLNTHKSSTDHDGRYFTETELGAVTDGASGADRIGSTTIAGVTGGTVQAQLESLKTITDGIVAGELSDLTNATYTTEATVTQEVTSIPSTAVTSQLDATLKGNSVINILADDVAGCESTTGWTETTATVAIDSSNEYSGTNCLKITLSSGTGSISRNILPLLNVTKYYLVSAYIKNGNTGAGLQLIADCNGDVEAVSSSLTTNTQYVRHGIVLQPSDFDGASSVDLIIKGWGSDTQYGYVDAIQLQEITSTEYALGATALLSKYAYHKGLVHTNYSRVKSVGKNLFDLKYVRLGGYYSSITGAWTTQTSLASTGFIPVAPNQQYIVSGIAFNNNVAYFDINKNFISGTTSTTTRTIPNNPLIKYMTQAIGINENFNNLLIELGSTATTYEPYKETTAYVPTTLRSVSDTIRDAYDLNTGKYTQNVSDVVELFGNIATWTIRGDITGAKSFSTPYSAWNSTALLAGNATIIKYDGNKLAYNTGLADSWATASAHLWLIVSDSNSGWDEAWTSGTSFTGMTFPNLIKAYMNGWKLTTANVDVASCVWTGITSGTTQSGSSGYSHVIANVDAGFQPYRMIYQLATPTVVNYFPNTLTVYPSGTVYNEPCIQDVGIYSTNIAIASSTYPIASLDYVNKIDINTGTLTPIALSSCTVAGDGLTFTISGASASEYYEYGYLYKDLSTVASLSYLYGTNIKAQVDTNTAEISSLDNSVQNINSRLEYLETDLTGYATTTSLNTEITDRRNGDLENSLEIAKGLFTVQAQITAGQQNLSNMAINAFNDNAGIDGTNSLNEVYDASNKLWQESGTIRSAKTVTATGNAQIDTAVKKYGTGSILFDGNGDYLSIADSADFNLTGDMTIQTNLQFNAKPGAGQAATICGQFQDGNNYWALYLEYVSATNLELRYQAVAGGVDEVNVRSGSVAMSASTMYHIRAVRIGNTYRLFLDGTQIGTDATDSSTPTNLTAPLTIGSLGTLNYFNGWMDEFEIVKGVARDGGTAFTPPTAEIVPDAYTVLLLHGNGTDASTTITDDVGTGTPDGNMTLITDALSCSSAPTYGYIVKDVTLASGGSITYSLSRDNGTTWTTATPDTLVNISAQPSGTSLKVKAVTAGSSANNFNKINALAWGWK